MSANWQPSFIDLCNILTVCAHQQLVVSNKSDLAVDLATFTMAHEFLSFDVEICVDISKSTVEICVDISSSTKIMAP